MSETEMDFVPVTCEVDHTELDPNDPTEVKKYGQHYYCVECDTELIPNNNADPTPFKEAA